jgi:hypothetical protein
METGSSGRYPDDPGEGWIDPNAQRNRHRNTGAGGPSPIADDPETMKNNNFTHTTGETTNDYNAKTRGYEKPHVYTIKVNAMLPKGSQEHRPLWLMKELLLQFKIIDPETGFMTETPTTNNTARRGSLTTQITEKLTDPEKIPAADTPTGAFAKKYLHELKLVQSNVRMIARITVVSKATLQEHRKHNPGMNPWLTEHRVLVETYALPTLEAKLIGFFTKVHASSKSTETFQQLLLRECQGLDSARIPFMIR